MLYISGHHKTSFNSERHCLPLDKKAEHCPDVQLASQSEAGI
jgi:hypothetical protein